MNLNPRALSSLLIVRDSSVSAGNSESLVKVFCLVFPPVNCQMKVSKEVNSRWILRNACALVMAAAILARFLIMPSAFMSRSRSVWVYRAIFWGLNPLKACLSFSRLSRIIHHERPAWNPSRIKNSKCRWSLWTGTPHSSS